MKLPTLLNHVKTCPIRRQNRSIDRPLYIIRCIVQEEALLGQEASRRYAETAFRRLSGDSKSLATPATTRSVPTARRRQRSIAALATIDRPASPGSTRPRHSRLTRRPTRPSIPLAVTTYVTHIATCQSRPEPDVPESPRRFCVLLNDKESRSEDLLTCFLRSDGQARM